MKHKIISLIFTIIILFNLSLPASASNYQIMGRLDEINNRCTDIYRLLEQDKNVDDETLNYLKTTILSELKSIQNGSGGSGASSQQIADLTSTVNTLSSKITTLQNSLNTMQTKVDNIDVVGDIESFYESKTNVVVEDDADPTERLQNSRDAFQESILKVWNMVHNGFTNPDGVLSVLGITIDPSEHSSGDVFGVFRVFAYSLVVLFFAVNLVETTLKYEIMTLRGGASILGRLLISKTLIDVGARICLLIIETTTWLTGQILGASILDLNFNFINIQPKESKLWVIGAIIDFFNTLIAFIQLMPIGIVFLVCGAIICIKLLLRSIELSLLTAISPVMFACASSDVTKPYFRNFIVTFIQVAAQIVFMALVYIICMKHVCDKVAEINPAQGFATWNLQLIPTALLLIAMCIMMCKPPKVLTTLIR